jgi:hypothetical protein
MSAMTRVLALCVVLAAAAGTDMGQTPASQPASAPAAAGAAMTATVVEVSGTASRLTGTVNAQEQWAPLAVKDVLGESTVIRTGLRSKVVLAFADNSVVVIDRGTKMGIGEFRREAGATKTSLGLKYGAMRAEVDRAKGPNNFTVASPTNTLALEGSGANFSFSGDFGFQINVVHGQWRNRQGHQHQTLGASEGTDAHMTAPSEVKLLQHAPRIGDVYGGLSPAEQIFLAQQNTGQGGITFTPGGLNQGFTVTPPVVPVGPTPPGVIDVPGLDIDLGGDTFTAVRRTVPAKHKAGK